MRRLLALAVLILSLPAFAAAAAAQGAYNDYVVVPGVRVGPISKYTSVEALHSLLPNAQIRHDKDQHGDRTTVIYRTTHRDTSAPDLIIRWQTKHRTIRQVTIFRYAGAWRTVEWIAMNTPLEAVHQVNGKRFPLRRLRTLLLADSWGGGKLSGALKLGFAPADSTGDLRKLLPADLHSEHKQLGGEKYRVIGIVVDFQ